MMDTKDIRKWYHDHGIPYEAEDWGPRSETGESDGHQPVDRERADRHNFVLSRAATPEELWWWEKHAILWRPRSGEEADWLQTLDDFFAPYLAMLPRAKGNLVRAIYGDLATYEEAAQAEGIARQSAHEATKRAVRDLTRRIAEDDPLFRPPPDGRRRDYEDEARAARRVFMVYLARRRAG